MTRLHPCLSVSLSLSLVSLGLSHVSAISGGSLALGNIPFVSVSGSPSLHPCWAQHNFTCVPPRLWNCVSMSQHVCLSASFWPLRCTLVPIHFWELTSHLAHSFSSLSFHCLWLSPISSLSVSLPSLSSNFPFPSTSTLQNPRNHCCSQVLGWDLSGARRWSVT